MSWYSETLEPIMASSPSWTRGRHACVGEHSQAGALA